MGSLSCPMCCGRSFCDGLALACHLENYLEKLRCPLCDSRMDSLVLLIVHMKLHVEGRDHNVQELLACDNEKSGSGLANELESCEMDQDMDVVEEQVKPDEVISEKMESQKATHVLVQLETGKKGANGQPEVIVMLLEQSDPAEKEVDQTQMKTLAPEQVNTPVVPSAPPRPGYKCRVCPRMFPTHQECIEHVRRCTGEKPFQCIYCEKNYASARTLNQHLLSAHLGGSVHQCRVCRTLLPTRAALVLHEKSCQGKATQSDAEKEEASMLCEFCGVLVSGYADINEHLKKHVSEKNRNKSVTCPNCPGKLYKNKESLRQHMATHSEILRYTCEVCSKAFRQHSRLQEHMMIHTGERPHICDTCGKGFLHRSKLNEHVLHHQDPSPYPCKECGKRLASRFSLAEHLRQHTGEKPYKCQQCGSQFGSRGQLAYHKRSHIQDQDSLMYMCGACGRHFRSVSGLHYHRERAHGKREAYACTECGKVLDTYTKLVLHRRLHASPHTCTECGRRFHSKRKLSTHVASHDAGKLRHVCSECGAAYSLPAGLQAHNEQVHQKQGEDGTQVLF